MKTKTVHNTTMKPQAKTDKKHDFHAIPEEKQQPVEETDADNIRKVLCTSFSQWF